jgi:hypothetical protein
MAEMQNIERQRRRVAKTVFMGDIGSGCTITSFGVAIMGLIKNSAVALVKGNVPGDASNRFPLISVDGNFTEGTADFQEEGLWSRSDREQLFYCEQTRYYSQKIAGAGAVSPVRERNALISVSE